MEYSLINPSDVDSIAKIIMKYQLMDTVGTAGLKYAMPKDQMEKYQEEQARLSIIRQRRELGYEDDDDYNRDLNKDQPNKYLNAAVFEGKRRSQSPKGLSSVWKEAEEDVLKPIFKWATFMGTEPTAAKEASHVTRNAILRAVGSRIR